MRMRAGRSALGVALAAPAMLAVGIMSLAAPAVAQTQKIDPSAVIKSYAGMARAVYADSLAGAKALRKVIGEMLARPSPETLAAARKSWIDARVPYLQSEAFRFTDPVVDAWEGKVNAWPLDEGLIDYVAA